MFSRQLQYPEENVASEVFFTCPATVTVNGHKVDLEVTASLRILLPRLSITQQLRPENMWMVPSLYRQKSNLNML